MHILPAERTAEMRRLPNVFDSYIVFNVVPIIPTKHARGF